MDKKTRDKDKKIKIKVQIKKIEKDRQLEPLYVSLAI